MPNLILRWSIGTQDTTKLADFEQSSQEFNILWLAKLSILSFKKWFPNARCVLFYNGDNFYGFRQKFKSIELPLDDIEILDQQKMLHAGELKNSYKFLPQGVWWKWVPFRLDPSCHEISIDTDIICVNDPLDWKKWIDGKHEIIVAPERFKEIVVNTCGDLYNHPVLKNKSPINCGIVGQREGHDFSERFYEIVNSIRYGYTYDSLFITEQGAINVWAYSLQDEGIKSYILDFEKCAWIRDFVYYLQKGVRIETIHATTWHKNIAKKIKTIIEQKVLQDTSDELFLLEILKEVKGMDFHTKHVIERQLGENRDRAEFFN
jgi:hypothetical protein